MKQDIETFEDIEDIVNSTLYTEESKKPFKDALKYREELLKMITDVAVGDKLPELISKLDKFPENLNVNQLVKIIRIIK